jgi:lipoyl(octanoyl) transferase
LNSWIIEEAWDRPGAEHMDRDESLARERVNDASPNVLRLYTWKPWAVSLGYQQDAASVDVEECASRNVDIVRRPTGGRAVLHAEEITYAVIMRAEPGQGIYAAHNAIVQALLESIRGLGPEGQELALTGPIADSGFKEIYAESRPSNIVCFGSSARHEVTFRGRKVIGSAQRRFGEVVLQHGSILLGDAHLQLADLLTVPPEKRASVLELLNREATTLSDVFGRPITAQEVASCVRSSFVQHICSPHSVAGNSQIAVSEELGSRT